MLEALLLSAALQAGVVAKPYRLLADYDKVPIHSKACAVGLVVYRRKMVGDQDWHITITDKAGKKLVLEIIPEFPIDPPSKGDTILGCGIGRYDIKHKWPEIHPLLKWEKLNAKPAAKTDKGTKRPGRAGRNR